MTAPIPKAKPGQNPSKPVPRSTGPVKTQQYSSTGSSAAQQMVDAALAPLMNDLNSRSASLGHDQAAQQAALRGYTQQVIGYLKGTPGAIASDYNGAIAQQDGFAKQYAAMQRAANPNGQIQGDLAAIHAPASQRAQLEAQNRAAFGGAAANLYALGGAIPNSAFAKDRAGALAFARSLPAIEGLRGQQLFQGLLANQAKDTQALGTERAHLQSQAAQAAASASTPSTKAPTTRNFRDGTTRQYNPQTGNWDVVATSPSSTTGSGGGKGRYKGAYGVLRGMTPNAQAKTKMGWRQKAADAAYYAYHGSEANGTTPAAPPQTYQAALAYLENQGIPLDIAQNALNKYWRKPGDETNSKKPGEGRPKLSYQQRKALARKNG